MGYVKPADAGRSPRTRCRPPSLAIDSITAHYDDEVAWNSRSKEIPVRRTFIEFGSMSRTPPDSPQLSVSTAPARIGGFSMRESFDVWKVVADTDDTSASGTSCTIVAGPPSSTASSTHFSTSSMLREAQQGDFRRLPSDCFHHIYQQFPAQDRREDLPDVTYRLSPASAKAAGYWQTIETPTPRTQSSSLAEASEPSDPSYLLQTDLLRVLDGRESSGGQDPPLALPIPVAHTVEDELRDFLQSEPVASGYEEGKVFVRRNSLQSEDNDVGDYDSTDDGDSSDDDLGLCPEYSENVPLPSKGSAPHGEGNCKRCCFFPKGRCNNGFDCHFCHFAHEKRKPKSKKKKKRRKKHRQSTAQSTGQNSTTANNASSPQARSPKAASPTFTKNAVSPSFHQTFAGSPSWKQPPQRPSRLVVTGLQFVPATVMPGHPSTMPMLQMPYW